MKRFRWGDVVPRCDVGCDGHDPRSAVADDLHVLAVHGLVHLDPGADVELEPVRPVASAPAD